MDILKTKNTELYTLKGYISWNVNFIWKKWPPLNRDMSEKLLLSLCVCAQSCPSLSNPLDSSLLFYPWDFPGKNTRVGCHFQLQGSSNPCLFHLLQWTADSLPPCHLGSPFVVFSHWDLEIVTALSLI